MASTKPNATTIRFNGLEIAAWLREQVGTDCANKRIPAFLLDPPQDDLLTRLVEAEVDGERLTQEEILGFFQLLVVGGQETTTNLINNAILCFVENAGGLAFGRTDEAPAAAADQRGLRAEMAVP